MVNNRFIETVMLLSYLFFLEILLRVSVMGSLLNDTYFRLSLFLLSYTLFLMFIINFFKQVHARRIYFTLLFGLTILMFSLDLYYRVMGDFFSIFMSSDAWRGVTFLYRIRLHLFPIHLLYLLPLVVFFIIKKRVHFMPYTKRIEPLYWLMSASIVFLFGFTMIDKTPPIDSDSPFNYSELDIYHYMPSAYQVIDRFGALTYVRRDLQSVFTNAQEIEEEIIDEIDLFLSQFTAFPHSNTGLFEGYNLVFIVAESLDYYAFEENITPNLYWLQQNSWQFTDFYAPHYYRNTADTEFMVHTSLYPDRQVQLSMEAYVDNHFPMTLPRLFHKQNYTTFAYHNYVDYFYPRRDFLTQAIGFQVYQDAHDMGLMSESDVQAGNHPWPSDLEMLEMTYEYWIDEPLFYTYYLTVSGHMPYHQNHPQIDKNMDALENILETFELEIEDPEIKGYLAAQMELDKMIGLLINNLTLNDRLDDTVIILMSDHYPYGLDQHQLIEMHPTKDIETSAISLHNVPFLIYHPNLTPKTIDTIFSSVDVTPTIANLFNLGYDNYFGLGQDGLDNKANTVRFQNGSIRNIYYELDMTNQYAIRHFSGGYTDDDVMLYFNEMIYALSMNQSILRSDYYAIIKEPFDEK